MGMNLTKIIISSHLANPSGTMRHVFDLYSNQRPAKVYHGVPD